MSNPIIEAYKILQEKIRHDNMRLYLELLESKVSTVKAKSIQELSKQKVEITHMHEMLKDNSPDVRLSALKYLEKLGRLDCEILKDLFTDISPSIRKEAIRLYLSLGCEDFGSLYPLAKDPDFKVRFQLVNSFIEFYPEDLDKISDKFKDDPNPQIKILISGFDNISEIILSEEVPLSLKKLILKRYFESNDSVTVYNTFNEIYINADKQIKLLLIKYISGLPCEISKTFFTKNIDEEDDIEILFELVNKGKKICGNDIVQDWVVDKFINSEISKIKNFGFRLAMEKDDMNYVDYARTLLDVVEDELLAGAVSYLLHFLDYTLLEKVPEFLESLSVKRKNYALQIIKKLKAEQFLMEVAKIAENKMYPLNLRKNALSILKILKANNFWEIPYNILKDESENGNLKLTALTTLLKLNPEVVPSVLE
ncbi:HEAT repeat domain-containing protein [Marinitoga aeolica]|uniref:HEAT repeat domain-containing protein n=1 Tax=Marinitoga aeolica TaxID=2809031 RepID=A0ABY8PSA8_9BACT|nr:HEAT repeat domain-containing protein [Marinitoga aeolica]WGS65527.1 HEAT repeat domain-containing protein [Marinitoga aeolica]